MKVIKLITKITYDQWVQFKRNRKKRKNYKRSIKNWEQLQRF